jgi:hypothetical protein
MTEAEWAISTDPFQMLNALRDRLSPRKLRLFALACCRHIWHLMDDEDRVVVELAEGYCDGKDVTKEQLTLAYRGLEQRPPTEAGSPQYFTKLATWKAAWIVQIEPNTASSLVRPALKVAGHSLSAMRGEWPAAFAALARDICGNSHSPQSVLPSWRTPAVLSLVAMIYSERTFDTMPILGDALEEAGCNNNHFLDHCRSTEPHVRGCWVLDDILEQV